MADATDKTPARDRFDSAAGERSRTLHDKAALIKTREPAPEKLHAKGIRTEGVLNWLGRREPPVLEPEPTPEDPAGWRTAIQKADTEHARAVEKMRGEFRRRFEKSREDFRTAHDYRYPDRSHER